MKIMPTKTARFVPKDEHERFDRGQILGGKINAGTVMSLSWTPESPEMNGIQNMCNHPKGKNKLLENLPDHRKVEMY